MDLKVKVWVIKAKINGICAETGKDIKAGDTVLYLPGVKGLSRATVFCNESWEYKEWVNKRSHLVGFKI